jgi:hypothetical protein
MGLRARSSVVSTSLMVDTFSVPSLRNLLCAVNCALTLQGRVRPLGSDIRS